MSSPMDALFADPGQCRRFAPDVAVHWYPEGGTACFCGELTRPVDDDLPTRSLDLPCPTCHSPAGQRCRSLALGRVTDFHVARYDALRAAQVAARAGAGR